MKLSSVINFPLGLLGFKIIRKSKPEVSSPISVAPDIAMDASFMEIYSKVKDFTMVDTERCYALYQAVLHIIKNNIPGDFAECGVWKGGSCMLVAYTLLQAGKTDRKIWLYDTFMGMSKPGVNDGPEELEQWANKKLTEEKNEWCLATVDEAKANMLKTGYPEGQLCFIKGKVEETIPGAKPNNICLLRLDTDWYESTRHELLHLYPLLQKGGVLIIDDYGAWQGARRATDEYFNNGVFLNRIDWTGRMLIK